MSSSPGVGDDGHVRDRRRRRHGRHRADRLAVADGRPGRVREREREGLVVLRRAVGVRLDLHGLRRLAGGEGQRDSATAGPISRTSRTCTDTRTRRRRGSAPLRRLPSPATPSGACVRSPRPEPDAPGRGVAPAPGNDYNGGIVTMRITTQSHLPHLPRAASAPQYQPLQPRLAGSTGCQHFARTPHMWLSILRRRSQKDRFKWTSIARLTARHWPKLAIRHPRPDQRLAVSATAGANRGRSRML